MTELVRQKRFPDKASEARSSLFCVEIHNSAPLNPTKIPMIFIVVIFSWRKSADKRKTQIGCMDVKIAAETGVVLLSPIRYVNIYP